MTQQEPRRVCLLALYHLFFLGVSDSLYNPASGEGLVPRIVHCAYRDGRGVAAQGGIS